LGVKTYEREEVFCSLLDGAEAVAFETLESLLDGVVDDEVTCGLHREPGAPREYSVES